MIPCLLRSFFYAFIFFAVQAHSQSLLIENVALIDGTGAARVDQAFVLIDGGRFSAISNVPISAPEGIERVDGTGKFLIPGIIDGHIHLVGGRTGPGNRQMVMNPEIAIKSLEGYLYSGVTAIYDSGNNAEFIYKMRADERAGRILSPRIYATVSYDYEDGVRKLDALFKLQPDLLKFTRERRGMGPVARSMPLIDKDLMNRLVSYAHDNGIRSTIHVSEVQLAREAIMAGADAFAHTVISYLGYECFFSTK